MAKNRKPILLRRSITGFKPVLPRPSVSLKMTFGSAQNDISAPEKFSLNYFLTNGIKKV